LIKYKIYFIKFIFYDFFVQIQKGHLGYLFDTRVELFSFNSNVCCTCFTFCTLWGTFFVFGQYHTTGFGELLPPLLSYLPAPP